MISGFFFEPNAAIFLIYALRRSSLAPPPGNKVLKEGFRIWAGVFLH